MRISATTLESFRLFMQPDQEWMTEADLHATIRGEFVPNHKVNLGTAFGRVLEDPDRYLAPGGFRLTVNDEVFEFGRDVMEPCLAVIDRRGVFEAKQVKSYGPYDVVSKADHVLGADLSEFKTTLSGFDPHKYLDSCQWRFMADAFQPRRITYYVFCLYEAPNRVIELKSIERMPVYPYPQLHADCADIVTTFAAYVKAKGLDGILRARQEQAA
jgi:hypothetical protein